MDRRRLLYASNSSNTNPNWTNATEFENLTGPVIPPYEPAASLYYDSLPGQLAAYAAAWPSAYSPLQWGPGGARPGFFATLSYTLKLTHAQAILAVRLVHRAAPVIPAPRPFRATVNLRMRFETGEISEKSCGRTGATPRLNGRSTPTASEWADVVGTHGT